MNATNPDRPRSRVPTVADVDDVTAARPLRAAPLPDECGLRLAGEIDISSAGLLTAALTAIPAACGDIRLDMTDVCFVDVVGTGLLVRTARRLEDGRRLILHHPPRVLLLVLALFPEARGRVLVVPR